MAEYPAARPSLLLVEDDPTIGDLLLEFLGGEGYDATLARSADEGLALLTVARFDLVITDGFAGYAGGEGRWALVEQIRRAACPTPVLICTAHSESFFAGARERGFAALLTKPFDLDALAILVARLIAPAPLGPDCPASRDAEPATQPAKDSRQSER